MPELHRQLLITCKWGNIDIPFIFLPLRFGLYVILIGDTIFKRKTNQQKGHKWLNLNKLSQNKSKSKYVIFYVPNKDYTISST